MVVRAESATGKPKRVDMSLEELIARLQKETACLPTRPLPVVRNLSKRPKFVGSL